MKNALLAIALGTSAACLSGSPGTLPPASGEVAAVTKKIVKKNVNKYVFPFYNRYINNYNYFFLVALEYTKCAKLVQVLSKLV